MRRIGDCFLFVLRDSLAPTLLSLTVCYFRPLLFPLMGRPNRNARVDHQDAMGSARGRVHLVTCHDSTLHTPTKQTHGVASSFDTKGPKPLDVEPTPFGKPYGQLSSRPPSRTQGASPRASHALFGLAAAEEVEQLLVVELAAAYLMNSKS